jgi:hypothetical protein
MDAKRKPTEPGWPATPGLARVTARVCRTLDVEEAALRQAETAKGRIAVIESLVSDLAQAMTGDRVQPSGRYGSAEEMLRYLIEQAKAR